MAIIEAKINEVFANRADFDKKRYVSRDKYETDLRRAITRFMHVFLTGESGCGKTWLTKYFLSTEKMPYQYINLAEVALVGGLLQYFTKQMPEMKTERIETLEANVEVNLFAATGSGSGEVTNTFMINNDVLWQYLTKCKGQAIVLDNFESVIDNFHVLNELSCLITLSDDPRMNKLDLKFLIIGALHDVTKYFQTMPNYQTIASRVTTVGVGGFTDTECYEFVDNSFRSCGFSSNEMIALSNRIFDLTGGMPQTVNDLCYYIAIEHFDAKEAKILQKSELVHIAEIKWTFERMTSEYSVINGYFKENVKNDVALNYVLISLQEFKRKEFSSSELHFVIENNYGESAKTLHAKKVKTYLGQLADDAENRNILVRTNADGYRVKSFKTYACLVMVLYSENNVVCCTDELTL